MPPPWYPVSAASDSLALSLCMAACICHNASKTYPMCILSEAP